MRAGARKPDVGRVQPQLIHQMEQTDLVLDGGADHRGSLKPVAKRLVVELDGLGRTRGILGGVPVVDELVFGWPHGSSGGDGSDVRALRCGVPCVVSRQPEKTPEKPSRAAL